MGEHKLPAHVRALMPAKRLQEQTIPVNVNIGHDGKKLVVQYSQKLEFISYTPDQARATIAQLQETLDNLEQHLTQEKLNASTVAAEVST